MPDTTSDNPAHGALPLQLGQTVSLTITGLAFGGEGVGRHEGVTVFVPDVCPGEQVTVAVREVHARFCRAELLSVDRPAPERVPPLCPVYGQCGGCQLQHLDYPAQLAAKETFVRDAVTRVGKLTDVEVRPIVASPLPYGYRNKLDLAIDSDEQGHLVAAYHGRRAGTTVPIVECPLALPEVNGLLDTTLAWLRHTNWPPYDEHTATGLVRGVELRWSTSNREGNLLLTSGRRDLPDKRAMIEHLRQRAPQLVGLRHRAKTRASQTPDGRGVQEMLGRGINFRLASGLSLRVGPDAFFQINDGLLPAMIEHLGNTLELQPSDLLADLYGGVGTFALALAKRVRGVLLLEIDHEALRDAEANVAYNKLTNVRLERGQVEQRLGGLVREQRFDKILLDPPRRGLSEGVVKLVTAARPSRLAYVSCDPATLARDLRKFVASGWRVLGVQPFDLFPQTYHVESVATLVPA